MILGQPGGGMFRELHLAYVPPSSVSAYSSMLGRNPKISFLVDPSASTWLEPLSVDVVEGGVRRVVDYLSYGGSPKGQVVVKFESAEKRDAFLKQMQKALGRKMWGTLKVEREKGAANLPGSTGANLGETPGTFKSSGAGIGGIIRRRKEKHTMESNLASTA
ncbi:hypothetical protein TrRE_jg1887, partial [Triparma retinervis]